MTDIFLYNDPVEYLKAYIQDLPKVERRGINHRLAKACGVFPSYFSLILKGERTLNSDQAMGLSEFLALGPYQRRYFLRLTDLLRAATSKLKTELESELSELRTQHHQISGTVPFENVTMTLEDQAKFYSSWTYAATRLCTSLPEGKNKASIAERLHLSEQEVESILTFLLEKGLCVRRDNRVGVGPAHMHLNHNSPLIEMHHAQWRLKSTQLHGKMNSNQELAYSFLVCLSKSDAQLIRSLLLQTIANLRKVSDPSPTETLYLLNLDWLEL